MWYNSRRIHLWIHILKNIFHPNDEIYLLTNYFRTTLNKMYIDNGNGLKSMKICTI